MKHEPLLNAEMEFKRDLPHQSLLSGYVMVVILVAGLLVVSVSTSTLLALVVGIVTGVLFRRGMLHSVSLRKARRGPGRSLRG